MKITKLTSKFLAILFCLNTLLLAGCSDKTFSAMKQTETGQFKREELYPLLNEAGDNVMFNMTLTYKDMSMNGFLIATMEENEEGEEEIHAVCTAFMGMTLFDFSIPERGFRVNSCMEQLDNKFILRILKKDLVTLFTRNVQRNFKGTKYRHREPAKTKLGYKIRTATGRTKYLIDVQNNMVEHVSVSGGPLRAEFEYSDDKIVISHPKLGLQMMLYK